jgi:hypothetical protein
MDPPVNVTRTTEGPISSPSDLDAAATGGSQQGGAGESGRGTTLPNVVNALDTVKGVANMSAVMKLLNVYPALKQQVEAIVAADDEELAREYLGTRGLHGNACAAGDDLKTCWLALRLCLLVLAFA